MVATLKDVARHAGVSAKTVSNVVNGYSFVTAENRRKVQAAIEELGYVPNIGARNLRRGRTGFLTLAVPELTNPYFAELCGLVMTAATRYDWTVLIEQTNGDRDRELAVINSAHRSLVDAVILSPLGMRPDDLAVDVANGLADVLADGPADDLVRAAEGNPLVLLGERALAARAHHVAIDNIKAAGVATSHLIGLGRRRIAAIGDQPGQHGTSALRLAGYTGALREAGLAHDPSLTISCTAYSRAEGYRAMGHLLDSADPPDAVFCFNDLLAVGALSAARDRGLRVPEQVAVVGFDGTEEASYAAPRLTTIAPDKEAIAAASLGLISEQLREEVQAPQDITVPFTLVVRESTGA